MEIELKPAACPFCGERAVTFHEGSTCRWVVSVCGACDAQGPPERKEVMAGPVTPADEAVALESWNRRRPEAPPTDRERRLAAQVVRDDVTNLRCAECGGFPGSSVPGAHGPGCVRGALVAEARVVLAEAPAPKAPEDDAPLRCELTNGAVVIRMGERIIAFATDNLPSLYDAENDVPLFRVTDPALFAAEVVRELNREGEDGSTPLTRFLDSMIEEAIEQGADGIEEVRVAPSDKESE